MQKMNTKLLAYLSIWIAIALFLISTSTVEAVTKKIKLFWPLFNLCMAGGVIILFLKHVKDINLKVEDFFHHNNANSWLG